MGEYLETARQQLADRVSPLLQESGIGAVEFRYGYIPYIGVRKFIESRFAGHSPGTTKYTSLTSGASGPMVRLVYPSRDELGKEKCADDKNVMLAAHYGQSFEAEFNHLCALKGSRNFYRHPIGRSPLARKVEEALQQLRMNVVAHQYLVTHGFPEHPVQMPLGKRPITCTFKVPGDEKTTKTLKAGQKYLVGAIDLVLISQDEGRVVIADIKTTSDKNLASSGLCVENVMQLHMYAYMFQKMTRLRVHHMLMIVVNPLYNTVRIHSLRFDAAALTGKFYDDQKLSLVHEFNNNVRIQKMGESVEFCAPAIEWSGSTVDMVRNTEYIRVWLRDNVTVDNKNFTLPFIWDLQDTELVVQWLASLGFSRYKRSPWTFSRPNADLVKRLREELAGKK